MKHHPALKRTPATRALLKRTPAARALLKNTPAKQALLTTLLSQGAVWFGEQAEAPRKALSFGIPGVPELGYGALHELLSTHQLQTPPLFLLGVALREVPPSTLLLWIGKRLFPTPHLLEQTVARWEERCVFVDPPNRAARVWCAIEALSSPAIGAVVLDGSHLNFLSTRRLQLVARKHHSIALLVRQGEERQYRSAAQTKWSIAPQSLDDRQHCISAHSVEPTWRLEAQKAPGILPPLSWIVRWEPDKRALTVLSHSSTSTTEDEQKESLSSVTPLSARR